MGSARDSLVIEPDAEVESEPRGRAPLILNEGRDFKVVGTDLLGSGDYDHERGEIGGFAIWQDGEWKPRLRDVEGLDYPVELEALPPICGCSGVRFACDSQNAFAARRLD